ncbi:MAG: hypothetical protein HDS13_09285 [Bacteroides sp.]|nr:hypothetical protein [Bacteroides sp.]
MEKEKLSNLLDCIYELEGLVHLALARDDNPAGLGTLIATKAAAVAKQSAAVTGTPAPAQVRASAPAAASSGQPKESPVALKPVPQSVPKPQPTKPTNRYDKDNYEEEDTLYVAPDDEDEDETEEDYIASDDTDELVDEEEDLVLPPIEEALGFRPDPDSLRTAPIRPAKSVEPAPIRPVKSVEPAPIRPVKSVEPVPIRPAKPIEPTPIRSAKPVESAPIRPAKPVEPTPVHPAKHAETASARESARVVRPETPVRRSVNDEAESTRRSLNDTTARGRLVFSLNDRFRFRRSLFKGDDMQFTAALGKVATLENYYEAEDYFYGPLQWQPDNQEVVDFMHIIQRYFES